MKGSITPINCSRTDHQIIADSDTKVQRIRTWLAQKGFSSLILTRRENFAWITTGGDASVVNSTHISVCCVVITRDKRFLIAHKMDSERILREQIPFQEYELVELFWYEGDPINKAVEIAGNNPAADIPWTGAINCFSEILDLHYPMTPFECERLRWLGGAINKIFLKMGKIIERGMSEIEIASIFQYLQSIEGISSDVLISGSDERIINYRHPMPTNKTLEKYLMLHSASRKWGLHAPITRLFSLGPPEDIIFKPFRAVASIQLKVFNYLKPKMSYEEMLNFIKSCYHDEGYSEEWKNHFQGGPTGYVIVDGTRCLSKKTIQENTPFEWFFTVPGSKVAELTLLINGHIEMLSNNDKCWPQFSGNKNMRINDIPSIYVIE